MKKFETIMENIVIELKKKISIGKDNIVSYKLFSTELKREIGIKKDKVLYEWLNNFEELGYFKKINANEVKLCIDPNKPFEFEGE